MMDGWKSIITPPNVPCVLSRSGRKNYLFAGSDSGGERAAAMYTLIGSAKLNGIDPELYLRHVLSIIADYPIRLANVSGNVARRPTAARDISWSSAD